MLGRKNYTQEEIDQGKAALDQHLAAYRRLATALAGTPADKKVGSALESFEAVFFNNLTLVLDHYFVHRLSGKDYEGKDGNPLNEVRVLCDSLISNDGKLRADNQINLASEKSVLKLHPGDPIRLTEADFKRLSTAFFAELQRRFGP